MSLISIAEGITFFQAHSLTPREDQQDVAPAETSHVQRIWELARNTAELVLVVVRY